MRISPLEEVMGFAHYAADAYDDAIELRQMLIIDIASEDRKVEMLDRFAAAIRDWGSPFPELVPE